MFPIIVEFGPVSLHTYGLMVGAGIFLGIRLLIRQARLDGAGGEKVEESFYQLFFNLVLCGLLGGRILHVALYWEDFAGDWTGVFKVWQGGLVSFGGLAGIAAGFWLWYRKHNEIGWAKVLDWMAPGMAFAHAVGRIGCFFAGCCYGQPADVPWAVVFHDPRSLALLDVPLHPTQIYESLFLVALTCFLIWMNRLKRIHRRIPDGVIFTNYLFIYSVGRFLLEYLRGDYLGNRALTYGQSMSLALMAASASLTLYLTRNGDSVNVK